MEIKNETKDLTAIPNNAVIMSKDELGTLVSCLTFYQRDLGPFCSSKIEAMKLKLNNYFYTTNPNDNIAISLHTYEEILSILESSQKDLDGLFSLNDKVFRELEEIKQKQNQ